MPALSIWRIGLGLFALLALAASAQLSSSVPAGTSCSDARIRKPWEAYSDTEKTRYIEAVRLAITKGYHQKFVELHTEYFSEREAHATCMFMYWHRMYLLGYENMLRSLGNEYECLTIPYWDHLSATARRASTNCKYMEQCSPIYQDFGGSGTGLQKSIIVYNITIPRPSNGWCANRAMLSAFCGNATTCASCIVRGAAYQAAYPAEAYFASVYQQMFTYSNWLNFSTAIERGVHNTVHSALGGTMAYLQSPIDPIFYTHHSFIDALQSIYLKCQLGNETELLSADQKVSDDRVWNNCARRTAGTFDSSATITMNTRGYNNAWTSVRLNPNNTLYPFFKDLPGKFADYVDAKDLGVYSYTYMLQGALTNMYTNCKNANTIQASTVTLLSDEETSRKKWKTDGVLTPITKPPTPVDTKMRRWTIAMYESAILAGYTEDAARDQMEMILCVHKRDCLGGVEDYDAVFRANFHVTGHPRCFTIVKQIEAGDRVIGIPKWRQLTEKFFSCTKATRTSAAEATALEL